MEQLIQFLRDSYTPYHACENAESLLGKHGFSRLTETEDWSLCEGGKYYILRGGAIIAFTVGDLKTLSYKIAASHTDSPALKIKENPVMKSGLYATLNTETYGGGIWYSFFDRPLKLAGRVIKKEGDTLYPKTAVSPFTLTIPSVAIHQNRTANEGFSVNPQVDLLPLLSLAQNAEGEQELIARIAGEGVVSYDLYLVNADMPYTFGMKEEFLASPRIDNLTSVFASLQALVSSENTSGICVSACMNNEEIGSSTTEGADGDFMATVLKRIAYALGFDENAYFKALANSFLLSCDNAHAMHPNHPEKSDSSNKVALGGGVVLKHHANKAYITDAMSSAIVKTLLDNAQIPHQAFFNRSDARSGSTLGTAALRYTGMLGADIGIPQLAMHSACESFAKADYEAMEKALTSFYKATLTPTKDGLTVK